MATKDFKKINNSGTLASKMETGLVKPKVHIGLFGTVSFGIGAMVGSGIFISPTGSLKFAGSIGASLIIWALCGVFTLINGLVYAELGTLFPQSGGDFIYIKNGLGEFPAFLVVWIIPLFSTTASLAVMALGFSEYLAAWLQGTCVLPYYWKILISLSVITTMTLTDYYSVHFSKCVQIVCTIAKLSSLIFICISWIVFQVQGSTILPSDVFIGTNNDAKSYCLALYSCTFAYGGLTRIGDIADESINPKSNIPKAVIITISIVTVVYVLANVAFVSVLTKDEMLNSNAVVYDWSLKKIAYAVPYIQIGAMLSFYGSCEGNLVSGSRVVFAAARSGHYPEVISFPNVNSSVPIVAILVVHFISCAWLVYGGSLALINLLRFMITIAAFLSTISLIKIRYQNRKNEAQTDDFRTHISIPLINFLICGFLIVTPFTSAPRSEFLFALVLIVSGIIAYIVFIRLRLKLPGIDRITIFCQLLFCLSPTEKVE